MNRLKTALWLEEQGFFILPVEPRSKRPLKGYGVTDATNDRDLITSWLHGTENNYGFTGHILIDIDSREGGSLEDFDFSSTGLHKSGSGEGWHVVYLSPPKFKVRGLTLKEGVTVRGLGQYLIGPGSIHPNGGTYAFVNQNYTLAPDWLLEKLQERQALISNFKLALGTSKRPSWLLTDKNFKRYFNVEPQPGRFQQIWKLVSYCTERGATNEELVYLLQEFKPFQNKAEEIEGWGDSETQRIIAKVRDLHQHPSLSCDKAGCSNTPLWMGKNSSPQKEEAFWASRKELEYIHQAARAQMTAPWATLGAVLTNLVAATPPEVVLPATIGTEASLNLFCGVVAPSGGGKGNATKLAGKLFDYSEAFEFVEASPGSGEGILKIFAAYNKTTEKVIQHTTNALLNVDEIDSLFVTGKRTGSTLFSLLRNAFTGERIGWHYSGNPTQIDKHKYRACLIVSAQPLRSQWLLDEVDGGLPQRFFFVSGIDPGGPTPDQLPDFPAKLDWKVPEEIQKLKAEKEAQEFPEPTPFLSGLDQLTANVVGNTLNLTVSEPQPLTLKQIVLPVCEKAIQAVKWSAFERKEGREVPMEGHRLLVKLKVATALAILNGRLEVADEDWELSSEVLRHSDGVLDEIKSSLAQEKAVVEKARAKSQLVREIFVEEGKEVAATERVAELILKKLPENGDWLKIQGKDGVRMKVYSNDRKYFEAAIEKLLEQGLIEQNSQLEIRHRV